MGAQTKQVAHESEMYAHYFWPQSEMRHRMEPNPDPSHNTSEDSDQRGRQDKTKKDLHRAERKVTPNPKILKAKKQKR